MKTEEIRQRWSTHIQPAQLAVVEHRCALVCGARPLRPEESALVGARLDVAWLLAEVDRLRHALIATEHEVCQTLGAALGYPFAPGPDGKEDSSAGICVGEHVAGSLALEAAAKLRGALTLLSPAVGDVAMGFEAQAAKLCPGDESPAAMRWTSDRSYEVHACPLCQSPRPCECKRLP